MSRPLHIELADGLYHVTSRGDRRESIYPDDQGREDWLAVLAEVCSRFNWRCHADCKMTNHYHFVVETPEANLSKGMRQLNGVYTQARNRRHGLGVQPAERSRTVSFPSKEILQVVSMPVDWAPQGGAWDRRHLAGHGAKRH